MKPKGRTALLILGVRGSGNATLAGIFERAGWTVARSAAARDASPKPEVFDPPPIARVNDHILRTLDRAWGDPKPLPDRWAERSDIATELAAMEEAITEEFGGADRIVIDDPRMSRLLPLWTLLLRKLGYTPRCLIACRELGGIGQSLCHRLGIPRNHALLLWESYMLEAELHSRGLPRSMVLHDRLVSDWKATLEGALDLDGLGPEAIARIDAFLEGRNDETADGDTAESEIKPRIAALYDLLQDGLNEARALDRYRARWAAEWTERSPGPGQSNFGESLSRNLMAKSRTLAGRGELDRALAVAQEAIATDPLIAGHHHFLAVLYSRKGMLPEAEQAHHAAIARDPSDAAYHDALARVLRNRGGIGAAIEAGERAVAVDPGSAKSFYQLGIMQAEAERLGEAETSFRRAAECDPGDPRYFRAHSNILRRLDRIEEALEPAQSAVDIAEDTADYLLHLAKLLAAAGRFERAEQAFAQALDEGADTAAFIGPYRDLLQRFGRQEEAGELTVRLARANAESASALSDLALHRIELGRAEDAAKTLTDAAKLAARALGMDAAGKDMPKDRAIVAHFAEDSAGAPEKIDDLLILLSWRRARELAAAIDDTASPDGSGANTPVWPVGALRPAREEELIPRHGSMADRWQRFRETARQPGLPLSHLFGARPQLSVMIPVFDVQDPEWLSECLKSVATQIADAGSAEVIVVDDASENGLAEEIAAEFAPLVRYVRNPKNLGIVANHNRCIRLARGEFVHILHQDDRLKPDFYEKLVKPLSDDPFLFAAFSRAQIVDDDGRYRSDQSLMQEEAGIAEDFPAQIALRQRVLFPSIIVRRAAYEGVGGFASSLVFAFDMEMWARLSAFGRVWHEPEPLAEYRTHAWSVTNSLGFRTRLIDGMRAAMLNLDHVADERKQPILTAALYRLIRREWDRLFQQTPEVNDIAGKAALLEFLVGDALNETARDALIAAVIDRTAAKGTRGRDR
ncbi:MAG: glycosyltransferase [Pseudomonadota bacterium]